MGTVNVLRHMSIELPDEAVGGSLISKHLPRNGAVVASFTVKAGDQLMLMTDSGKLIRIPVNDIRIAGRNTQGVTLFKTDRSEKVVSVIGLGDESDIDEIEENGMSVSEGTTKTRRCSRERWKMSRSGIGVYPGTFDPPTCGPS